MLKIGDVIGEFSPAAEADRAYTNKIKKLMLVMGTIPGEGGWKVIVMTDTGFTNEIPEKDIASQDGRYIVGGLSIVMHAAGMPEKDTKRATIFEEIKDCAPIPEELRR